MALNLRIDLGRLPAIGRALSLADLALGEMLDQVGGLVESHARERIAETKVTPDGEQWEPWSEAYRKQVKRSRKPWRRDPQHLLQKDGYLLDSLEDSSHRTADLEVTVGSNMVYAARQQDDRPYLGIGPDDADEIELLVNDWIEDQFRQVAR